MVTITMMRLSQGWDVKVSCLSDDAKPTECTPPGVFPEETISIPNGAELVEIDTGARFLFNEKTSEWAIQPETEEEFAQDVVALKADMREVEGEVGDLKSAFTDLTVNNSVQYTLADTFSLGRILLNDGQVPYIMESTTFAYSDNIIVDSNVNVHVGADYRVIYWQAKTPVASATDAVNPRIHSWTDGEADVSVVYNANYPYLLLCVTRKNGAVITAEEAESAIEVTKVAPSIFETKEELLYKPQFRNVPSNGQILYYGDTKTPNKEFTQGRLVKQDDGSLLYVDSTSYAYTDGIKMDGNATIHVKTGYKVIYWKTNNFVSSGGTTVDNTGWTTGEGTVNVAYASAYPYLVICVLKENQVLSLIEAQNAVDITINGKVAGNYIVNSVAYKDGTIIACRYGGTVVRINNDGTEDTLLTVDSSRCDWRLCWKDSAENVYVSPHATWGTLDQTSRGLYRLEYGADTFDKVISLYDPNSSVETEQTTSADGNSDTIWTMCEDGGGKLYAGVYAAGSRTNPAIYKSTDGGITWTYLINFATAGYVSVSPNSKHIHFVVYNKYNDALYAVVGEVNTIFKSTDGGTTWTNLNVALQYKATAMLPMPYGMLLGSDGAYNENIDLLYNNDATHERLFTGWANTVFGLRVSDITGFIYAFSKIDISVNSAAYYPPVSVLSEQTEEAREVAINTWKNSGSATYYDQWKAYNETTKNKYPNDSIRPQHYGIIVSRDGGQHWEVLKKWEVPSTNYYGIWCIGQFENGECMCSRYDDHGIVSPLIISEGKHKYTENGCDLSGEVFVKTNTSNTVKII